MSLRIAKAQDAPVIAAFYADIRKDTVPVVHTVEEITTYINDELIARGSSYVSVEKGDIFAWIDVHEGWINQLYCRRGMTGKGIGLDMLEFAKEICPNGLQLYTFQVNERARKFYLREGFQEVELSDGSGNEEKSPDVRLEWKP